MYINVSRQKPGWGPTFSTYPLIIFEGLGACDMEVGVGVKKGEMLQFQRARRQSLGAVSMAVLWKPGSAAHSFPE